MNGSTDMFPQGFIDMIQREANETAAAAARAAAPLPDLCCGGTRSRIGCEYHDPALQPAAAPPAPPMASPYAAHMTGQHAICPCRACSMQRLTVPPTARERAEAKALGLHLGRPGPAAPRALPAGAVLLGPDDPEVLGPDTPPDLIYAVPGGGVVGVPQGEGVARALAPWVALDPSSKNSAFVFMWPGNLTKISVRGKLSF